MFILVFPQFSLHSVFLFTFPACFLPAFISFWYYLSLPLILGCSFLKMTGASIFPATAPLSPATGASSCQAHSPDGFFVSVLQWWHAVPVLHRGTAWALLQGEEELAMHRAGFCLPFFLPHPQGLVILPGDRLLRVLARHRLSHLALAARSGEHWGWICCRQRPSIPPHGS